MLQCVSVLGENTLQRVIHAVGMHIAEAKRNHAGQHHPTGPNQLPKGEVMDEQNASLASRLLHNVRVR
jgi:hypothetical protein